MSNKPKTLCVCRGGNVRSVCVAWHLKDFYGHHAVAIGFETCGDELMRVLCQWADHVLVVRQDFVVHIPTEFAAKIRVIEIGPDIYGNPFHDALKQRVNDLLPAFIAGLKT